MEYYLIGRIFVQEKSKRSIWANRACSHSHLGKSIRSNGPTRRPKPRIQIRAHILPTLSLSRSQHLSRQLHGMASSKNISNGWLHKQSHLFLETKGVGAAIQPNPNPKHGADNPLHSPMASHYPLYLRGHLFRVFGCLPSLQ